MRLIQVVHVVLVVMVALLASCDSVAGDSNNAITSAGTSSIFERIRRILSDEDTISNKRGSIGHSVTEEERLSSAATAAGEGGRTGAGGNSGTSTATTTTTSGGTVTVSKYWNNGLVQRFEKWFKHLFHRNSSNKVRRLRQL
ncbi:hypothetical protein PRIC1_011795 [Phytophthora ramorum]